MRRKKKYFVTASKMHTIPFPMALQPGVGLGLLQEFPPSFPL